MGASEQRALWGRRRVQPRLLRYGRDREVAAVTGPRGGHGAAATPRSDGCAAARVGACAIGLAYAERSGAEPVAFLIGLADGRLSELMVARDRIRSLESIDKEVVERAAALLGQAIRSWPGQAGAVLDPETEG